jgi:pSer/pThr/pTyr-binding forkhead associated (FHA) protein
MEEQKRFKITITGKGKSRSFDIDKDSCVLGRGKDCDIVLDDDLVSRHHLKVSIKDQMITIQELGSTNGTLLNGVKMEKLKEVTYTSESKVLLGGSAGLSLDVENLSLKNVAVDADRTLVHTLSNMTKKVANGSFSPSHEDDTAVTSRPQMKIVTNEAGPHHEPTKKTITLGPKKNELKQSLENEVKHLVNTESERLREKASKEANLIKQQAHKEAQEIIEQGRIEAAKRIQEAEHSITHLKDKIKASEEESELMMKNLKASSYQLEERIAHFKQIESGHQQKVKQIDDEYLAIKERVRNEALLLDELKQQSLTVKKSADLKLEELALEERRSRSKLETEIVEARAQTAKIFAEADKAVALKESLEPDILQLKNDKARIEKDINDAQINFRRLEYDYEKTSKEYQGLLDDISEAKANLEGFANKVKEQQEKNLLIQQQLEEKEKVCQQKVTLAESQAEQIIENAKLEAKKAFNEASLKTQKMQEQNIQVLKDLEIYKAKINQELEAEKKNKLKEAHNEIEALKNSYAAELEKLEVKKNSVITETKWLEENTNKNSEKILAQAKAEALEMKDKAKVEIVALNTEAVKNIETLKGAARAELQAQREKTLKELASAKENLVLETNAIKTETANACAMMKKKADEDLERARLEIKQDRAKIQQELDSVAEIKRTHQAALSKTESLMDENYLSAEAKIKMMLSQAQAQATEIQNEAKIIKAKEIDGLDAIRKEEEAKIEELKVKFEEYKVTSKNEMATSIGLAVQEFLIVDMVKSRNLIMDEKLIRKISERAKKITIEATLGRIQASNKASNPFAKSSSSSGMIIRTLLTLVIGVGVMYVIKTYPTQCLTAAKAVMAYLKSLDLTLPF